MNVQSTVQSERGRDEVKPTSTKATKVTSIFALYYIVVL